MHTDLFCSPFNTELAYVTVTMYIPSVGSGGSIKWCIHLCLQTLLLHPRGPLYQLVQAYAPPNRSPRSNSTADPTSTYVRSVTSTSSVLKGPLNKPVCAWQDKTA